MEKPQTTWDGAWRNHNQHGMEHGETTTNMRWSMEKPQTTWDEKWSSTDNMGKKMEYYKWGCTRRGQQHVQTTPCNPAIKRRRTVV